MIHIKNLSKIYSTEEVQTHALNDININIWEGDFVAIMGPSGCGKSTLLNILGILDTPSSGNYFFEGQDVFAIKQSRRNSIRKDNIGFIFQNFNLIDELNVYDNIELPLIYNGIPSKERSLRVKSIMENMSLSHRAKHFPQQLSGGQQQRVAVARALVNKPKLVLADEPTGNLDSSNGNDVMNLLAELHRSGTTIVMVTHSSYDARFASRIVYMKDGAISQVSADDQRRDLFIKTFSSDF